MDLPSHAFLTGTHSSTNTWVVTILLILISQTWFEHSFHPPNFGVVGGGIISLNTKVQIEVFLFFFP